MWPAGLGLLTLAACWLIWALVRTPSLSSGDSRDLRRRLYLQRITELQRDHAQGLLDAKSLADAQVELATNLLEEWPGEADPVVTAQSRRPFWPWIVVLLVPLCAAGLYWQVGEPGAQDLRQASEILSLQPNQIEVLESWQQRLSRRLERHPEDAKSWYLQGHARLKLGQYEASAAAFNRARILHPEDPSIDLYWLQAQFLAAKGRLDLEARKVAQDILSKVPNQLLILEIFALDAFERGDFKAAVTYLNRALANPLPEDKRAYLQNGLVQARSQLGDSLPGIDVAVQFGASRPPGATLFIIARPLGGGMPFAVIKRSGTVLPARYRLDDAVSMNPAQPLSKAQQFEIVVRLSLSGSVGARPGDWEWRSGPIELQNGLHRELTASLVPPA